MSKPICIDLYAGLGGWADGFLAEGYEVIGFDIERHDYGSGGYPGALCLQDVLTIHGSQFKDAAVIVASPPCQTYSWMAMPWSRGKAKAAWYREDASRQVQLNALFDACFRIQREASEAAGRYIPLIVENVRGACDWVGQSRWHYGSFHLWGDVPALMPMTAIAKARGQDWNRYKQTGEVSPDWKMQGPRQINSAWRSKHYEDAPKMHLTNQRESDALREPNGSPDEGVKHHGSGPIWFNTGQSLLSSKSNARKAASAQIARIPLPLARHIARVYKPD